MDVRRYSVFDRSRGPKFEGERSVGVQYEMRSGAGVGHDGRHFSASSQPGCELVATVENHEQARERLFRRVRDVGGRPAYLLQAEKLGAGFDGLELGYARDRSHDLNPAQVRSRFHQVHFRERVIAVLRFPQFS